MTDFSGYSSAAVMYYADGELVEDEASGDRYPGACLLHTSPSNTVGQLVEAARELRYGDCSRSLSWTAMGWSAYARPETVRRCE